MTILGKGANERTGFFLPGTSGRPPNPARDTVFDYVVSYQLGINPVYKQEGL